MTLWAGKLLWAPIVDALMAEIMGRSYMHLQHSSLGLLYTRCVGCILCKDVGLRQWVGSEIKAMLSRYPEEAISFPNLNKFIQEMFIEHLHCATPWEKPKQMQKLK